MKVALVHDLLVKLGGGESTLRVLADIFPNAPIHTLVYDEEKVGKIFPKIVRRKKLIHIGQLTGFFGRLPRNCRAWRLALGVEPGLGRP